MKRIVICSAVLGKMEAVQKKYMHNENKENIYIYIYTRKKIKNKKVFIFIKQRRFHQVKVTSPFFY